MIYESVNPKRRVKRAVWEGTFLANSQGQWAAECVLTGIATLLAWHLASTLETPLIFAIVFCVPLLIAKRSLGRAFLSFCITIGAGVVFLKDYSPSTRIAYLLVGVAFSWATLHISFYIAGKLAEAKAGLRSLRGYLAISRNALSNAGVIVIVLSRSLTWKWGNEVAKEAFGMSMSRGEPIGPIIEVDEDTVSSFMHSGSKEAWRRLREEIVSGGAFTAIDIGEALAPINVKLFSATGRSVNYVMSVTRSSPHNVMIIGRPDNSMDHSHSTYDFIEPENNIKKWLQSMVEQSQHPAAVLDHGGVILSLNAQMANSTEVFKGLTIFDATCLAGVNQDNYLDDVWAKATYGSSTLLKGVRLNGARTASVIKLRPPSQLESEQEVLLITFS